MSGGYWMYENDNLSREIFGWTIDVNYGERGFKEAFQARRINPLEDKQLSELCWDLFCVLHSYDWYISGDCCEETYREDVKYFKDKWLRSPSKKLERSEVDKAIEEARQEIYKSLGIDKE